MLIYLVAPSDFGNTKLVCKFNLFSEVKNYDHPIRDNWYFDIVELKGTSYHTVKEGIINLQELEMACIEYGLE